ncbi:hypothetical protein QF015_001006 [Paenarthrobacter sp. TE4293]
MILKRISKIATALAISAGLALGGVGSRQRI